MHVPRSQVNWHLTPKCNYRCKFCFATFGDWSHDEVVKNEAQLMKVSAMLRAAGASRVTFVGGEPLLHPLIEQLLAGCKAQGLVTAMVTNGRLLDTRRLERMAPTLDWLALSVDASSDDMHAHRVAPTLDWLALSVDASSDDMHAQMGRGRLDEVTPLLPPPSAAGAPKPAGAAASSNGKTAQPPANGHLAYVRELWDAARRLGIHLKLNTVVTRVNLGDDMSSLVAELRPERWKVFQLLLLLLLPLLPLLLPLLLLLLLLSLLLLLLLLLFCCCICGLCCPWKVRTAATWSRCSSPARVQRVEAAGVPLIAESNAEMQGTYSMLDARCRFFSNNTDEFTGHVYGRSIFEAGGVQAAWADVGGHFDGEAFKERGGLYDWGQRKEELAEQLRSW
ncbi:hypothetical protein FOA52_013893 [Chlamydomonas sp. UWO 241]|nr:hypothetical protein FOA52_013893 [Chlamydomonas sp. UWO 241]